MRKVNLRSVTEKTHENRRNNHSEVLIVKPKTATQRVNKLRADAKGKGWKRRDYYATIDEHGQLKQRLKEIRE